MSAGCPKGVLRGWVVLTVNSAQSRLVSRLSEELQVAASETTPGQYLNWEQEGCQLPEPGAHRRSRAEGHLRAEPLSLSAP